MHFLKHILNWFRRRPTFAQIDPDTLRRERIRIEQTEKKMTEEIKELEKQKVEYFRQGIGGDVSDRQRLQVARKIKQIESIIKAKDGQLTLISKNLQVLASVAQLKENERLLRDLGMDGVVSKMNLEEVQNYIDKATVEGQFQMDRFTKLLRSVQDAEGLFGADEADQDTQAILEAMEVASRTQTEDAVREGVEQVGRALRKPEPASAT